MSNISNTLHRKLRRIAGENVDEKMFGKIPDHHLIIPDLAIYRFSKLTDADQILYGTSTFIDILEKDGKEDELEEFLNIINECVEITRPIVIDALNNDKLDEITLQVYYGKLGLLPWTVSPDTFYQLLPFYQEIEEHCNTYTEKVDHKNVQPFYVEYVQKLKAFLRKALEFDDYLINTQELLQSIIFVLDQKVGKQIKELRKKMKKILRDIEKLYNTKVSNDLFEKFEENGLVYRIIPENFYFYRAFSRNHPPFSKNKYKMSWAGFNFIEIISYARPQEKKNESLSDSVDYCNHMGYVASFRTKAPLKLLDLGDPKTIYQLYQIMDETTIKSLEEGWEYVGGKIKRHSVMQHDGIVSEWLCKNGILGYIGIGFDLHDEIMVCVNEDNYTDLFEITEVHDLVSFIPFCKAPYNQIEYKHMSFYG